MADRRSSTTTGKRSADRPSAPHKLPGNATGHYSVEPDTKELIVHIRGHRLEPMTTSSSLPPGFNDATALEVPIGRAAPLDRPQVGAGECGTCHREFGGATQLR